MEGQQLSLTYAYSPGQEEDGLTLALPYKMVEAVDPEVLEWLVPGFLEEKVVHLLRSLPKALRRQLIPIPQKAREIATELRPDGGPFIETLAAFVESRYGLRISRRDWGGDPLPKHLQMRVDIQGTNRQTLVAGRNLSGMVDQLERHDTPVEIEAWKRALEEWEQTELVEWTFGDLPERIEIAQVTGISLVAFPGIDVGDRGVDLRLFRNRHEAQQASRSGVFRLAQIQLEEELSWLERNLRELDQLHETTRFIGNKQEVRGAALAHLQQHLIAVPEPPALQADAFENLVQRAVTESQGLGPRFLDLFGAITHLRMSIQGHSNPYPGIEDDLQRLAGPHFLKQTAFTRLPHVERYLRGIVMRADRFRLDPAKDRQKVVQLEPYHREFQERVEEPCSRQRGSMLQEVRWMLEEFRISLFAQELGTDQPISGKRLDRRFEELRAAL